MRIIGVIPARYASTRFPGKSLIPIAGKPLVQHVVERCREASSLSDVIVATDDERIAKAIGGGCQVEMTRAEHPSGTDRVAEVAARHDCDGVVNVQGDEPLIDPGVIDAVAGALVGAEMSTAATLIRDPSALDNPAVVKVVVSGGGRALCFSRRALPFPRDWADQGPSERLRAFPFLRHLGIYGYRRDTLLRFVRWPTSGLEAVEKLEQLRALENGVPITVVRVQDEGIGVDTPEDVARVEPLLRRRGGVGTG